MICTFGSVFRIPVEEPVACADDSHAAHEVSEGDGNEVFENEVYPCKPFCGKTIFRLNEKTGRDIEHVGNAVFEPAEYKNHDRRVERGDLAGNTLGAHCHPHGDTDEDVAQDGAQKCVGKGQGCFSRRGGKKVLGESGIEHVCGVAVYKNGRYEERTKEVSEIYQYEIFQKTRQPYLFIKKRDDHKAVARKKLASCEDYHGKPRGEDNGRNKLCCRQIFKHGAADRGSSPCEGDEHSRKKAEEQQVYGGEGSLADAGFGIVGCDIG